MYVLYLSWELFPTLPLTSKNWAHTSYVTPALVPPPKRHRGYISKGTPQAQATASCIYTQKQKPQVPYPLPHVHTSKTSNERQQNQHTTKNQIQTLKLFCLYRILQYSTVPILYFIIHVSERMLLEVIIPYIQYKAFKSPFFPPSKLGRASVVYFLESTGDDPLLKL